MRKEVLIAISFGSLFGIIIAFGIWKVNSSLKKNDNPTPLEQILSQTFASPNPNTNQTASSIAITSPATLELITSTPFNLKGKHHPNSQIILSADTKDLLLTANSSGEFETQIDARGGINTFLLTSFSSAKEQKEVRFAHSTEVATTDSTPPKAYIGRVTDKTETGIQIEAENGQILQATINQTEVEFVRITNTSREVNFDELAIGDFVACLGHETGSGIMACERVIITVSPDLDNRQAWKGSVDQVSRNQFTFSADNQNYTIKPISSTSYFKVEGESSKPGRFSDVASGKTIITVGKLTNSTIEPRSIFVLP